MTDNRRGVTLRSCFQDGSLDVMNFLNEATSRFPAAISFGPGRPLDAQVEVEAHGQAIERFVSEAAISGNRSRNSVWVELGQYGRTNGAIAELIASHLRRDEDIDVDAGAIMVTVGAQEAMAIVVAGLFEPGRDILLVSDPTYIGVTGIARILGVRVWPVPSGDAGLEPDAVEQAIVAASQHGRVRALYDIPDFNNPLGTSLSVGSRRQLLDVCHRHDVLVIEDNPYGMYAYDHERRPTLKSLDVHGTVLYIGSFAKTLYPGLRVGYLVADQRLAHDGGVLAQELSKVKSLTTVNTAPLMQAVVGGILAAAGGTLEPIVGPKREVYRARRDAMVAALGAECGSSRELIQWRVPSGGFFLPVTLPFEFGADELQACALEYGVIVCPMRFFSLSDDRRNQVRLSFSYVTPEQIHEGVRRLSRFVRDRRGSAFAPHETTACSATVTRVVN